MKRSNGSIQHASCKFHPITDNDTDTTLYKQLLDQLKKKKLKLTYLK